MCWAVALAYGHGRFGTMSLAACGGGDNTYRHYPVRWRYPPTGHARRFTAVNKETNWTATSCRARWLHHTVIYIRRRH
jgi:hypothetical protein